MALVNCPECGAFISEDAMKFKDLSRRIGRRLVLNRGQKVQRTKSRRMKSWIKI